MKPRPLRAAICGSPRYGRATVAASTSTSDDELWSEPLHAKSTSEIGKPARGRKHGKPTGRFTLTLPYVDCLLDIQASPQAALHHFEPQGAMKALIVQFPRAFLVPVVNGEDPRRVRK